MQPPPLDQPFNFQVHTRVYEAIEVPVCMFERQRVGIGEVRGDLKVKLSRETQKRQFFPISLSRTVWNDLHLWLLLDHLQGGRFHVERKSEILKRLSCGQSRDEKSMCDKVH